MKALNCVPEERLPCTLRHGGIRGGMVRVVRGAGEEFLEAVEAVVPLTLACSPCRSHPVTEFPQVHHSRARSSRALVLSARIK